VQFFDEVRLHELKLAAKACFDLAVAYEAPFVSGKDSMFNDFRGFDKKGPVALSVPPTLLATAISVIDDASKALSIDFKQPGDVVYLLGETNNELGASEYAYMLAERENTEYGGDVPHVSTEKNSKLYHDFALAGEAGLIASAISIGRGGLAYGLARSTMAGKLGAELDLSGIEGTAKTTSQKLFAESQGRILVSVAFGKARAFEAAMRRNVCKKIGEITSKQALEINDEKKISVPIEQLLKAYRGTFEEF
jgi:phosphoribosylformylglycinamidine (FGAM) synthase-like enzyme